MNTGKIGILQNAEVIDSANRRMGAIEELLVDLESGQIVGVVVKADKHRITVPWNKVAYDQQNARLRLNANINEAALFSKQ